MVVEEVHKIFRRVRLWRRFKSWLFAKLDIGVHRPPDGEHVLKGVSFKVYPGEIFCLMGRNGCGKTILMSILSGFLDATSGNVSVNGFDVHHSVTLSRECVGFSPQSIFFLDNMTVEEQFMFAAALKSIPRRIALCDIEVVLKMVRPSHSFSFHSPSDVQLDIYDKRAWLPFRLSEGEKKRVQIGLAFIGNPQVILIDDLSTGLDAWSKRTVWKALQEMKQNRSVIITSHDPLEASYIADRLGILEDGMMKANGSPVFLKSRYVNFQPLALSPSHLPVDRLRYLVARRFETGYRVRMIESGDIMESQQLVAETILARCPNAQSMNDLGVELVWKIPFSDSVALKGLLYQLEHDAARLGIRDLSVGTTDIVEVLERACEDNTAEAERVSRSLTAVFCVTTVSQRKARQTELQSHMAWASYFSRVTQDSELRKSNTRMPSNLFRRVSEQARNVDLDCSARSTESSHWSSLAWTADTAECESSVVVNPHSCFNQGVKMVMSSGSEAI